MIREKAFKCSLLSISLVLGFLYMFFITLRYVPSYPICWGFYHKRMSCLVKCFLDIHWDNQVILSFIVLMQCITSIDLDVEPSLHPMDKFHLVMVYNFFNVLLNLVSWYLDENFCIYIYPGYWHIVFFNYNVLVYLISRCNIGLIEWV